MALTATSTRIRNKHTCTDQVVGAILSGWRYDISGIPADLRVDYEDHLQGCEHCRRKQRLHRTIDVLLLSATTLSFAAFLLAALVMHRLEATIAMQHLEASHHITNGQLTLHASVLTRIPRSITLSLKFVAIAGVVLSMLLWVLIAMVTPIPAMLSSALRERVSPELRERLWKQAA